MGSFWSFCQSHKYIKLETFLDFLVRSMSLDLMLRSWLFGQEEANSLRNKVIKIWVSPIAHGVCTVEAAGGSGWEGGFLNQFLGLQWPLSTGASCADLGKLPECFAPILSQLVWGLNKLIHVGTYHITFENTLAIVVIMIKSVESIETSLLIINYW